MKILFVIGHPDYQNSVANKIMVENLKKHFNQEDLNIRNLIELYPDYKINVSSEQKYLLEAKIIVFQFPIYWASMPAILKLWIDEVFTNGFAFGTAYKLKEKKILISTTLSGEKNQENISNVKNKILFPFIGLANFCKMKYLSPTILYDVDKKTKKEIEKHTQKLIIKIKENEIIR